VALDPRFLAVAVEAALAAGRLQRQYLHRELHRDMFGPVLAVAMLDRVDDGFPHRHADPVRRVLVEAGDRRKAITEDLNEIEHLERAGQLQANQVTIGLHRRACG
jgi:hypothetical protein